MQGTLAHFPLSFDFVKGRPWVRCVRSVGVLFAVLLLLSNPTFAQRTKPRCVDIKPARVKRVGTHWLLLRLKRTRMAPPNDYRTQSLDAELLDERSAKVVQVRIAMAALAAPLAKAVMAGAVTKRTGKGKLMDAFFAEFRQISDDGQTIALEIRSRHAQRGSQRVLMLVDRKTGKGTIGAPFQQVSKGEQETAVHVGQGPAGGHLYVLNRRKKLADGRVTASIRVVRINGATASPRTVIAFTTSPRRNSRLSVGGHTHLSRDGTLLAIAEYLESPKGEAKVHVVNLDKATKRSLPAPVTTYGLAISPDNKRLFMGSNRLSTLEVWDLKRRKRLRKVRGVKRLHKAFYSANGKRIWVASKGGGLTAYDAKTLKRRTKRSLRAIFGKVRKGALFARIDPRPRGLPQTVGLAGNNYGFGALVRLCTLRL